MRKIPTKKISKKSLGFQYDTLIARVNFCNRLKDIAHIGEMVSRKQKIIIYAPRRFWKTSLMQNIVAKDFVKLDSKAIEDTKVDINMLALILPRPVTVELVTDGG